MPPFLVPRNTSTHRVAAIALYRALLASCASVPVVAEERETLRNVVRNKFRRNQLVHSSRLLSMAFCTGYDTLDMFDRAVKGDTASIEHISELLDQTAPYLKRPPRPPRFPKKPEGRPPAACPPPEQQLLATRPFMSVSGKRKVPKLRVNNGIPFLMYSKPQPQNLGRILRFNAERAQKRQNWHTAIEHDMMPQAKHEDFWDNLLEASLGIGDCDNPDEGAEDNMNIEWTREVDNFREILLADWKQQKMSKIRTGRIMQGIVDREEVLAKKEEEERKSFKKKLKQNLKAKRNAKPIDEDQA
ncbi:uncharacterized protein IWZ02DRAFT_369663 [Phyllosticta citriasiana]|uniref:uncharacterized protein n=1 Tax=Phyllosticta citriasiana TaxID=595635 RepID=UPI0030FDD24E